MKVSVAEPAFELGVQFVEFVAEGMRNVDFPGWLDRRDQSGPEGSLIEANQEQAGVAAVGSEFVAI